MKMKLVNYVNIVNLIKFSTKAVTKSLYASADCNWCKFQLKMETFQQNMKTLADEMINIYLSQKWTNNHNIMTHDSCQSWNLKSEHKLRSSIEKNVTFLQFFKFFSLRLLFS